MKEKKALELADKVPEWVGELLAESAKGARGAFRWFILTLYSKGYEIRKKEE